MIVADKEKSISKANEIADELHNIISDKIKNNEPQEDPAEIIYLTQHIMGNLLARHCIVTESYGKIYEIPNLNEKKVIEWINIICLEYIEIIKSKL